MSGSIAFDNSGTLSEPTVVATALVDGYEWATPVPGADPDRGRIALLSIDHDSVDALRTDVPIGPAIERGDVPTYLALANVGVTPGEAREALLAERETPASVVPDHVDRAIDAAPASGTQSAGAQLVVDLDAERAVKAFGYTVTPRAAAPEVVTWAERAGLEPHIVSGDSEPVLQSIAETVGIPAENVHPYQSADDKRRTVEALADPVVMVGDYVNDRFAFEVADAAILVAGEDGFHEALRDRVDVEAPTLSALPSAVELRELVGKTA